MGGETLPMIGKMDKHFTKCDDETTSISGRYSDGESSIKTPYFDCVFKQLSKLLICPYVFIT